MKKLPVNTYELDISHRAYTALKKIGIEWAEDLLNLTKKPVVLPEGYWPQAR